MNNTIPYDGTEAASLSQRIALLLCGLEMEALSEGDCARWRTKPKVHLMEELIEYQTLEKGSPCQCWTYKDDSWGMWVSTVTARRGGKTYAWNVALSSLLRCRYMMHKLESKWKKAACMSGCGSCAKNLIG